MVSKTLLGKTNGEIREKIEELLQTDFNPTLAIVFCPITVEFKELSNLFNTLKIEMIGASCAGGILNGELKEEEIVVMLTNLRKSAFRIYFFEGAYQDSFDAGKQLSKVACDTFASPTLILFFSLSMNGEQLLDGIRYSLTKSLPIYGGMASDETEMRYSVVFNDRLHSRNGIVTLIFNSDIIDVNGFSYSGWQQLGNVNTITKANGNQIYTINNRPGLEVFEDFLGRFENLQSKADSISIASAQYPLSLVRNNSSILRAPIRLMEDKSILLAGPVNEGDKFRFSMAPSLEIIDRTIENIRLFKLQIDEPDALIMVSCKARHFAFGPLIEDEIQGGYNIFCKPIIGLLSYGELGKEEPGPTQFLNETCTLISLTEKKYCP